MFLAQGVLCHGQSNTKAMPQLRLNKHTHPRTRITPQLIRTVWRVLPRLQMERRHLTRSIAWIKAKSTLQLCLTCDRKGIDRNHRKTKINTGQRHWDELLLLCIFYFLKWKFIKKNGSGLGSWYPPCFCFLDFFYVLVIGENAFWRCFYCCCRCRH